MRTISFLLTMLMALPLAWGQSQLRCSLVFATSMQSNQLWNPLQKWQDGIPSHHKKITKDLDLVDLELMLNSFFNKVNGQPVESGIAEILNHRREVIFQTEIVTGQVAQVDLRSQLAEVLSKASLLRDAAIISYRHTHPPALVGHHTTYNTWKFSEADVKVNESLRRLMNKNPNLSHLSLEASILYLDPSLTRFTTSLEVFKKFLKVKAYKLDAN